METSIPRWWIVAFSVGLTVLTGALVTSQLLNGVMVYSNPNAMRDGQYFMVFGLGCAVGCIVAIPAAVLAGVLTARNPAFASVLSQTLLGCLVIGVGLGLLLASVAAGANGLGWAIMGLALSPLGILLAPAAVLVFPHTLPVSPVVGGALVAAVAGAYWYHRRKAHQAREPDESPPRDAGEQQS